MQSAPIPLPAPEGSTRRVGASRKGCPNYTTRRVRHAILRSFSKLGGIDYLGWLGKEHPPSYAMLLARLPPQVRPEDGHSAGLHITVEHIVSEPRPTPGVLCSPEPRDIGPPRERRPLAQVSEVIEA